MTEWVSDNIPELIQCFYPGELEYGTIATPDLIASNLSNLIQRHPSALFAIKIPSYITEIANSHPQDIPVICQAILHLWKRDDATSIVVSDLENGGAMTTFGNILTRSLGDHIENQLVAGATDDGSYLSNLGLGCHNPRLSGALLSASTIRNGIQQPTSKLNTLIRMGLGDPKSLLQNVPEANEIFTCIALLHLATVGYTFEEAGFLNASEAAHMLKDLKQSGKITTPSVAALLDSTLHNAESGFRANLSEEAAWVMLFPDKHHKGVPPPSETNSFIPMGAL